MLFSLRDIQGFKLQTVDGNFGEVKAFLIDDFDWVVRYLIVDIDDRMSDRHAILSPRAVSGLSVEDRVVVVNVDLDKILNSPSVEIDQDLSRELERQLSDYYNWPYYWEPTEYPVTRPGDLTAVPLIEMELERQQEEQELIPETGVTGDSAAGSGDSNFHLRSTHEIFGYTLYTSNDQGNAGKLHDFIVQDENWSILYMVADTGGLLSSGRKVLVAPTWVEAINEDERRIEVNLSENTIKNSPEFNTTLDLTSEYQTRLSDHYRA